MIRYLTKISLYIDQTYQDNFLAKDNPSLFKIYIFLISLSGFLLGFSFE